MTEFFLCMNMYLSSSFITRSSVKINVFVFHDNNNQNTFFSKHFTLNYEHVCTYKFVFFPLQNGTQFYDTLWDIVDILRHFSLHWKIDDFLLKYITGVVYDFFCVFFIMEDKRYLNDTLYFLYNNIFHITSL